MFSLYARTNIRMAILLSRDFDSNFCHDSPHKSFRKTVGISKKISEIIAMTHSHTMLVDCSYSTVQYFHKWVCGLAEQK